MRLREIIGILLLALVLVNALPKPVTATIPTLTGSFQSVNNGPNDQTAPDLDCNLISYINNDQLGSSLIHYSAAPGSPDFVIPGNGLDSQPHVSGNRIAFTELGGQSTGIVVYDTLGLIRTDIAGAKRSNASIGGDLVAYEDRSYLAGPNQSELGVYDLSTQTDIRLTDDLLFDKNPAVSPTGNAVVWEKCQTDGLGCNVYASLQTSPGVFSTRALTTGAGENRSPDTNGQVAVYISNRTGENDIYYQPLAGGAETRIAILGDQRDLSISGNLISFESRDPNQTQYDIFVYDLNTATLYQVTNTPGDEFSSRISFCNGVGRIAYVAAGTDFDVYAFTFQLPSAPPPPPPPPPSPADEINALIAQVQSYHLMPSLETTLVSKLQDALAAVNANNTAGACSSMTSFISKVQSQSDKKIDPDEKNALIGSANQIKTHLGCQ